MPRKKAQVESPVAVVEEMVDTDRDGLSDAEELALGSSPDSADTDRDGLTDAQELRLGTDPLQADTDRDGVPDGVEIRNNRNPLVNEAAYCPTLAEMREWRSNAVALNRNAEYLAHIGTLAGQMLAGTQQASLPNTQRDPDFRNPNFTLSKGDRQLMQQDVSAIATAQASQPVEPSEAASGMTATFKHFKGGAMLFDEAAIEAAAYLQVELTPTVKGDPALKLTAEQVEAVKAHFLDRGYQIEEIEKKVAPKAVFFEGQDGETYYLFNRSAHNVSETLNLQLDEPEDCRSMLTFDRQTYRTLKEQLQTEHGFEVSTNDLKATLASYQNESGKGALVNGNAALVVAHAVGVKVKQKDFGDGPVPQVNLTEAQIPQAQAVLQANNYRLIHKEIELPKASRNLVKVGDRER